MRMGLYVLDDKQRPVPEIDAVKWGQWYEKSNRHVGLHEFGSIRVSTVFLGVDHGWAGMAPVLWETMVFDDNKGPLDGEMTRCSGSWEQAEAMHQAMVARVASVNAPG